MYEGRYLKEVGAINYILVMLSQEAQWPERVMDLFWRQELFQAQPQEFKSMSRWFLSLTIKLREKEANRELLCKITIKINVNYSQPVSLVTHQLNAVLRK